MNTVTQQRPLAGRRILIGFDPDNFITFTLQNILHFVGDKELVFNDEDGLRHDRKKRKRARRFPACPIFFCTATEPIADAAKTNISA